MGLVRQLKEKIISDSTPNGERSEDGNGTVSNDKEEKSAGIKETG